MAPVRQVWSQAQLGTEQLTDRVLSDVSVIVVSCVSTAQLGTEQLTDSVLSDVSVIVVSCVSTAQLGTEQLTDRVLSDVSVIVVSWVSMAQLRTVQLKEDQVEVSTVRVLITLRCHTPSNDESQMKLILQEATYIAFS